MKKLIPALSLLLISAILVSTSTFAWFSMNTTVTATGMTITAKSNATYLLINTANNAAEGDIEIEFTEDPISVYPAKFLVTGATLGEVTIGNNSWYTANNAASDAATGSEMNFKAVDWDDNNYMVKYTMYLTLSSDSEAWTKYIKVAADKGDSDASANIVLKVTNGSTVTYIDGGNGFINCTLTNLTNESTILVEAYVYIDGTVSTVKSTADITTLTGEIGLTFDLVDSAS